MADRQALWGALTGFGLARRHGAPRRNMTTASFRLRVLIAALASGLAGLAGCGPSNGDWPQLMPVDQVLAQPGPKAAPASAPTAPLIAQANVLRARADQLRRKPVIEPEIAARMKPPATP